MRCAITCGLAHAWYKHASVPKAFAWEVEGPKYLNYLFRNLFVERPMQDDVSILEALSEAAVRYSLNFMKNVLWESTSRLPPMLRRG